MEKFLTYFALLEAFYKIGCPLEGAAPTSGRLRDGGLWP
jgi:hypothetical protein